MHLAEKRPAYFSKAKGCQVWDLDGNKYTNVSHLKILSVVKIMEI